MSSPIGNKRRFGSLFEQTYIDRAMEMTKTGNQFFWEPDSAWYFAAQREHRAEKYIETLFTVQPIFFETRLEIWPTGLKVTAMKFTQPYPNLIMLYHQDMCVWNRGVMKPRDKNGQVDKDAVIKIDLTSLLAEPIMTIQGIDPNLRETLQRNWQTRKRIGYGLSNNVKK